MTSVMWGPLGHFSPTLAGASWHTKTRYVILKEMVCQCISKMVVWGIKLYFPNFFQITQHLKLHLVIWSRAIKRSMSMYTQVIYFSSVTVIDWILPVVSPSWAGQWCRHATHYPTKPETPGSLGWTASGRPTGLVGSTCHLTPFFVTTTTIVTTSSLGSSCTATGNPCGAIVTDSPGSWVAIFWNKTLLVLTGEFDADNGGYGKQNALSYWVMFLKILLLIKGLNM